MLGSVYSAIELLLVIVLGIFAIRIVFNFRDYRKRPVVAIKHILSLLYLAFSMAIVVSALGIIVAIITGDGLLLVKSILGIVVAYFAREVGIPFIRWLFAQFLVSQMSRQELENVAIGQIYEKVK